MHPYPCELLMKLTKGDYSLHAMLEGNEHNVVKRVVWKPCTMSN